jgi:hypothetical protein
MATQDQFSKMYDVEIVGGDQRKRLAEMLRANALNTPQGQMVSGWYVPPSWSQNLAHLAQTATGVFGGIAAEDAENKATQEDLKKYAAYMRGSPERQVTNPETGVVSTMPAIKPNMEEAYNPGNYQSVIGKKMALQGMQQMYGPQKYTQHIDTPQGRVMISETGQTMRPMLDGKALYSTTETPRAFERGEGGAWTPNAPIMNYELGKARAGASSQTVINAGPKALNTKLGTDIGENIFTTRNQAQKAFASNTQLDTIQNALPNAIVGTGANARVDLARLGETLGVGGKTNEDRLRNTGALMQGLAQNELNAAEMMKGQGQITENERNIIRKAAAGEVTMTAPELTSLNTALRKINNYKISLHQQNVDILKQDPNARELYPYVAAPLTGFPTEVPQAQGQQPVNVAPRPGARFKGYVNPTGTR